MSFQFTDEQKQQIEAQCARYPTRRAALLYVLWMVQRQEGYVSLEACEAIASVLDISPAAVDEVRTFYSQYERKPCARHHLQVCKTIGCWLHGSSDVIAYLEEKLGIQCGEQTEDGRFKLSAVECLASCGTAPMMQVGDDYHEGLTKEKVDQLLETLT